MKSWHRWLADFRPGEFAPAARLHAQFGMIVLALLLGRTVRDAVFLSRAGVGGLPWLYVGTAVVATAATLLYTRALKGRRPRVVAPLVQAVIALGFALLALLLSVGGTAVQVGLYLWVEVLSVLGVVQFWNIANEQFNPRQAKRLYGFIAAGQAIGNLLCGVIASGAGRWYPVEFLLVVVIGLVLAAGALYLTAGPASKGTSRRASERPDSPSPKEDRPDFRRYVMAIVAVIALTYLATAWVDFQFKVIARRSLDEAGMVRFFGQFYGAVGVVSFVIQFFLLRHLSDKMGLFGSLVLMPAGFAVFGGVLPLAPILGVATALKFSENAFRYAVYDPLLQTLFLPLPGAVRARVQSMASGIVKPMAMGLAGLALVPLRPDQPGGVPVEWLGPAILLASVGVVALLVRMRGDYVRVLVDRANPEHTLMRRGSRVMIDDPASLDRLAAVVASGGPAAVAWVLDRVEMPDTSRRARILAAAVARADLDMPLRARCVLEAGLRPVELEGSPSVLLDVAAVRAGEARPSRLLPHLDDPDVEVREAVVRALLEQSDPDALLAAREAVVLAMQGEAAERMLAVRLADRLDLGERIRVLRSAFHESDTELVRRALQVLARHPNPDFLPEIVEATGRPAVAGDAVRALAATGIAGLDAVRLDRPWRRLGAAWPVWCREAIGVSWPAMLDRLMREEPDPRWWAPAARRLADEGGVTSADPSPLDAASVAVHWNEQAAAFAGRAEPAAELVRRAAGERRDAATIVALALAFRRFPPPVERWTRMLVSDLGEQEALRANVAEVVDQRMPRGPREALLGVLDALPKSRTPAPGAFLDISPLVVALASRAVGEDRHLEDAMHDLIDRVLFLSSVPLFRTLGGEDLERIAGVLEARRHTSGTTFIRAGEAGDSLFLITGGRVRVHLGETTFAELDAGSVVGEMALLDDQPRSADVTALDDVTCLRLDRADFDAVLTAYPAISRGVMRVLTERLRKANRPAA